MLMAVIMAYGHTKPININLIKRESLKCNLKGREGVSASFLLLDMIGNKRFIRENIIFVVNTNMKKNEVIIIQSCWEGTQAAVLSSRWRSSCNFIRSSNP